MLSLVAYEAPTSSFSSSNAYQQVITDDAIGTFGPGTYSLWVANPNSYFQVDFVCGAPLTQILANGSQISYGNEGRLISADNGGTQAYATSSLSGTVYFDVNGNDSFGSGDTGLASIPLTLTGTTGTGAAVTATTSTNSSGNYTFSGLVPGFYTITETQPSNYITETSNPGSVGGNSGTGVISSIGLNSNLGATGYNFGETLTPTISVVKTADASSVTAGQTAGYTVVITNNGKVTDSSVTLSDPLAAGSGNDINWKIDTSNSGHAAGTNPSSFAISGSVGNQSLGLASSSLSLAPGQSISVHITGVTGANDAVTSTDPALNVGGLARYAVLYEGTGSNALTIANDIIVGNIGVGGGQVQFNGPGTINGRLDFSGSNAGQYHNNNWSNVGPSSVNYGVSAVTTAINAANSLSSAIGALSGTNISFNNSNPTINESSGALKTTGGVTYRVFNVTSYSESTSNTVTINGDGSGDPVAFNFAYGSNTNLANQVVLTGGLTADQVLWNFTSSGKQVTLSNCNGSFSGVILLPNDLYVANNNSNLYGRVFGGSACSMQIISGADIYAPATSGTLTNTATVNAGGASQQQSTAVITINSASAQLAAGSTSTAGVGAGEIVGSTQLHAGTLDVAVNLPIGPETQAEAAAIRGAIASLDAQLAPLGVSLVEVSGAAAASAPIHIGMASSSEIGGVSQGVLGAYSADGDITLIQGWDWYFGKGSARIASNQYDFQSVVTHELGHALGLGENSDASSAMSLYLSPGQAHRDLSKTDLNAIHQELQALQPAVVAGPKASASRILQAKGKAKASASSNLVGLPEASTSLAMTTPRLKRISVPVAGQVGEIVAIGTDSGVASAIVPQPATSRKTSSTVDRVINALYETDGR